MANTYAVEFNNIRQKRNIGRIGRPEIQLKLPFTIAEEMLLEITALQTIAICMAFTPNTFREMAINFANKHNIYWDLANYDSWYPAFLSRHPFLWTVLHPEQNPLNEGYEERLKNAFEMENIQRSHTFDAAYASDVRDTYVADCNNAGEVILRKITSKDAIISTLWATFLFNYRGFVAGTLVYLDAVNGSNFGTRLQKTVNAFHDPDAASGCSFIQELASGLRVHKKYCFKLNIAVLHENAKILKWAGRHFFQAASSIAPINFYNLLQPTTLDLFHKIIYGTIARIQIPFDASEMDCIKKSLDLNALFRYSTDQVFYCVAEMHKLYRQISSKQNCRIMDVGNFSKQMRRTFPDCNYRKVDKKVNSMRFTFTVISGIECVEPFTVSSTLPCALD